nr:transcriptional regulator [Cellulomonas sp. IC4_254]
MPVLHALRVRGVADAPEIARRTGLPEVGAEELLLDAEASGLVVRSPFAGPHHWSLTERGAAVGEALLAAQLDRAGARSVVEDVLTGFGPVNDLVTSACTRWQLTELGLTSQPATLDGVLRDLAEAADALAAIEARLVAHLPRFEGYQRRFTAALGRARADPSWITATDRDSAHRVWFELHEDLLATLGIER